MSDGDVGSDRRLLSEGRRDDRFGPPSADPRVRCGHRPYGLMVLEIEGDLIGGIVGFPDPWLFEQCGLLSEL